MLRYEAIHGFQWKKTGFDDENDDDYDDENDDDCDNDDAKLTCADERSPARAA